jgi:hypothetical protein
MPMNMNIMNDLLLTLTFSLIILFLSWFGSLHTLQGKLCPKVKLKALQFQVGPGSSEFSSMTI